jgi:hypothetical protein
MVAHPTVPSNALTRPHTIYLEEVVVLRKDTVSSAHLHKAYPPLTSFTSFYSLGITVIVLRGEMKNL